MEERVYNPQFFDKEFLKNKSGIYQIRNIQNNYVYIGSSKNLFERYKFHFSVLKRNKHENPYLQGAYNKYGKENFTFEILEYCEPEIRFNIEQYWIDRFYGNNCYNINKDATNPPDCTGKKHVFTEEHKRNISISQKKRFENPEVRKQHSLIRIGKHLGVDHVNSKPVICLETGKEYAGLSEASRETGLNRSSISACCRNKYFSTEDFHWLYKEDYEKLNQEQINEIIFTYNNFQQVVCLETEKCYKSIFEAAKDTGIHHTSILKCAHRKKKEVKGTHWILYEDFKNMSESEKQELMLRHNIDKRKKCLCIETGEVFESILKAAKALNLAPRQITACCKGQKAYTQGYHFKFIEGDINA